MFKKLFSGLLAILVFLSGVGIIPGRTAGIAFAQDDGFHNIENDKFWHDTDGNPIFSQGGGIFTFKDPQTGEEKYYWYGVRYTASLPHYENPSQKFDASDIDAVTCYSSTDLVNWTYEGDVLTSEEISNTYGQVYWGGRMGVAYLEEVDTYAMFIQIWCSDDVNGVLIATCDTPTGEFQCYELLDMRDFGCDTQMTGDQTVFTDDDGTSYLVYSRAQGRHKIYISRIGVDEDGRITLVENKQVYHGTGREGNCMFKYKDKYYLVGSALHGWNASLGYYLMADDPMGPYTPTNNMLVIPGTEDDYCHVSQTGFFVTVKGTEQETVIFCGDRWANFAVNGLGYNQWCPMTFNENYEPYFHSLNSWYLNAETGEWYIAENNNYAKNFSFDADRIDLSELRGWRNDIKRGSSPIGNTKTYTKTGKYALRLGANNPYEARIYQNIDLPDGIYTLQANVINDGDQDSCQMYAKSGGMTVAIEMNQPMADWTTVTLNDIQVKDGKAEIGFKVAGDGGQYCYIDDVSFKKSDKTDGLAEINGLLTSGASMANKVIEINLAPVDGDKYYGLEIVADEDTGNTIEYTIPNIEPGKYTVTAYSQGHEIDPAERTVELGSGEVLTDIIFELDVISSSIIGRVVNQNGSPIVDAKIELIDGEEVILDTVSEYQGQFTISDIEAGEYTLSVSKDYHIPVEMTISLEKGVIENVGDIELVEGMGTIRGTVYGKDGERVTNATVSIYGTKSKGDPTLYTVTTDAEGQFLLEDVLSGPYFAVASASGYSMLGVAQNVEVEHEGATVIRIGMPTEEVPVINGDFEQALNVGWINEYPVPKITTRSQEVYRGKGSLSYYNGNAYQGHTYQTLEDIPNGIYVVNVMVDPWSNDNDDFYLYAKNGDGEIIAKENIPGWVDGRNYRPLGLVCEVTDGTLTIGIYGDLTPGSGSRFDDVRVGRVVDKIALAAAIEEAKGLDESDYTAGSWSKLQAALAAAEAVLEDSSADHSAVNAALAELLSAIAELEEVDKTALAAAIEEAKGLDESDYTPKSWSRLQDALASAETVYGDDSAEQSAVDAALAELLSAMEKLEEMPAEGLGIITGTVYGRDGEELPNATVTFYGTRSRGDRTRYTVTTDAEGQFLLEDVLGGPYLAMVSASGYSMLGVAQNVEVEHNKTTEISISMAIEEVPVINGDFEQALDVGWINEYTYERYGCYITTRSQEVYRGSGSLAYYQGDAYTGHTYQTLEDIPNGIYVVNVMVDPWANDQDNFYLYAKNGDGEIIAKENIPGWHSDGKANWRPIGLVCEVNDGILTIGIYGDLTANSGSRFDDVKLGIAELFEKEVDKTALGTAIEEAKGLDESDYTAKSWSKLQAALAAAEVVLEDDSAEQSAVDAALAELQNALAELEEVPAEEEEDDEEGEEVDKTALGTAIEEAKGLDESDYTVESWSKLQAALAAAEVVLEDDSAEQSAVDAALAELQNALAELEEVPAEEEEDDEEDKEAEEEPEEETEPTPEEPEPKDPKTGDKGLIMNLLLALASMSVILIIIRRRRKIKQGMQL